jgi:hypothetical protein
VTLLAAGFVIGPSGHSIRAICEKSGANIQVRLNMVMLSFLELLVSTRIHFFVYVRDQFWCSVTQS